MTTKRRREPTSLQFLIRLIPGVAGAQEGFDEILNLYWRVQWSPWLCPRRQQAPSTLFPPLTYRTGPFAANGALIANGFADYMTMLNERDGGVGGVKVKVEECETGYNAQKGVECYESTKGRGALVSLPNSTGITLQLMQKAPIDKIPL